MNTDSAQSVATAMILYSAAAGLILASKIKREREIKASRIRKKRIWVKEWRKSRKISCNYKYLAKELRISNPMDYKYFLRMDELCFNRILCFILKDIEKKDTIMRNAIPASEKLAVTLRFLATGEDFKSLDNDTNLSTSFLHKAVLDVCTAIYRNMKNEFLKFPCTKEEWIKIAEDFQVHWRFPLCLGALDGKHIAFRPSRKNAALFHNYKGFRSIVLLAMADAHSKFTFVDIGCSGRISDEGVLKRSDLMHVITNADEYFPPSKIIGNNRLLPYVIVADEAFPLQEHIMIPYPYNSPEEWKRTYNERLSHAREAIERAFGILTSRFQILQKTIKLKEEKTKIITQCCCVLHNFLITNNHWYSEYNNMGNNNNQPENISSLDTNINEYGEAADIIRKSFAQFFSNKE